MKKALYPIIIILILAAVAFFVLGDSPKKVTTSLARVFQPNVSIQLIKEVGFEGTIYKISAMGDSVVVIATGNNVFIADQTSSTYRKIKDIKGEGHLYQFGIHGDTMSYFDFTNRKFTLKTSAAFDYKVPQGTSVSQAIFNNSNFIYNHYSKMADTVTIYKVNPVTKENVLVVQLNSLMKDKVTQNPCIGEALDGKFLSISPNKWCYIFSVGGYFLIYDNGKLTVHQTIDKRPFKKFEERKVKMGELTAYMCKGENDFVYNYQAATDGRYLYILSGIVEKKEKQALSTPIDAYDLNTFE